MFPALDVRVATKSTGWLFSINRRLPAWFLPASFVVVAPVPGSTSVDRQLTLGVAGLLRPDVAEPFVASLASWAAFSSSSLRIGFTNIHPNSTANTTKFANSYRKVIRFSFMTRK